MTIQDIIRLLQVEGVKIIGQSSDMIEGLSEQETLRIQITPNLTVSVLVLRLIK